MHRRNQRRHVFRVGMLRDAVAQVEHMTAAVAVAAEDVIHFFVDRIGRGEQHGGIHVALQRDFVADVLARDADVYGPVQANCIAAGVGDAFEPQAAALGEHDGRDLTPSFSLIRPSTMRCV